MANMRRFPCPYLKAEVELTPERERHIAERHPELSEKINECLAKTLADPDQVRRSSRFANARLISRNFEDLWGQKQLVVVVVSQLGPPRHWIITSYLTRRFSSGELEWTRN
jgi:hypothetical protein